MLAFIIALILCIASASLIAYGVNKADLWKGAEIKIRKPSVLDLEENAPRHLTNEYVTEVIEEYHNYRSLRTEIEKLQKNDTDLYVLTLASPLCYCGAIAKTMIHAFPDLSLFCKIALPIVITAVITTLPLFIVSKVFPAPRFGETEQELIQSYKSRNSLPQYPISEPADINNYIISRHNWYIFVIHSREKTRHTLRSVGYILMAMAFSFIIFIN